MRAPEVTAYQVWQHSVTREYWVVRVEYGTLTGVCGPLTREQTAGDPSELLFEDHPDDLEWIFRYSDDFQVVDRPR